MFGDTVVLGRIRCCDFVPDPLLLQELLDICSNVFPPSVSPKDLEPFACLQFRLTDKGFEMCYAYELLLMRMKD